MSINDAIAAQFHEAAKLLELSGANAFRVNAHAKIGRVVEAMAGDISELADSMSKLTAIDGIGESSARKIIEFVTTGKIQEFDTLRAGMPAGLLDVRRLPGVGPKTAKLLYEQSGVIDLATLKAKLDSGELLKIPRMGEKTLQNIRDSLIFVESNSARIRLGEAMPLAEAIVDVLSQVKGVIRVQYAGSLRRGRDTIGDLDILASGADPELIAEAFCDFRTSEIKVSKILVRGETKCSVRLTSGVQADLRLIPDGAFGAALMYFTGSKEHNVSLRELALKKGMSLNEYGLFPDDGESAPHKRGLKPFAAATETEIYTHLGLEYVPPEIREDQGEIARATARNLPTLIELADIKAELHSHTVASDGRFTIDSLIEQARSRGYHTIAITDHSRSSAQANGLSVERLLKHIDDIHAARDRHKDMQILAGSEVDILTDGRLDYDDEILARLDIVVASPHASLRQDPDLATKRLVAAVSHPLVHILGHPTGRIINQREGLQPDMAKVIAASAKHGTALEINSNYLRLDLRDSHVKAAAEAGVMITIDTDAHAPSDFDHLRYGVLTARRGWLTPAGCPNTWPAKKLAAWLKKKR
jgi:DNA polymerase (family X)